MLSGSYWLGFYIASELTSAVVQFGAVKAIPIRIGERSRWLRWCWRKIRVGSRIAEVLSARGCDAAEQRNRYDFGPHAHPIVQSI
jgi:hypothetical protein